MSAPSHTPEITMSERQPVAIDTDTAYGEQDLLLDFVRNRNLLLAQENKNLRQLVAELEAQLNPGEEPQAVKRIRRGAASKEV